MKKRMFRLSVALLAMLLVLPMAVACRTKTEEGTSDGATTPADTTPATPWKDILLERASEFNEDYTTLRLMTIDGEFNYNAESISGEDKAQYKRDMTLYETYGFDIEISHFPMGSEYATINNMKTMGGEIPHMLIGASAAIMSVAIEGSLQNLNDINTLDFESGYWVDSYVNNCAWDGRIYCTPTYSSRLFYHGPMAIMYNTAIANQLQLPNLYDLVDGGNWTLEKLAEYAALGHTIDGSTGETNGYGLCALKGNGLLLGLYGAIGGTYSTMDDEGNIDVDFSGTDANAKLKKIADLVHSEYAHLENWKDDVGSFSSGKDLFWYTTTGNFFDGKITGNENLKYGVLPLPKLDAQQSNYITTVNSTSNFFACAIKNWQGKDLSFVGYIMELYNYLSWDILRPAKFDTLMKYQVAQSGNDLRMLELIFDTLYYDHNMVYNFGNTLYDLGWAIADNNTENFTSTFGAKYRSKIAEDIQKYLGL